MDYNISKQIIRIFNSAAKQKMFLSNTKSILANSRLANVVSDKTMTRIADNEKNMEENILSPYTYIKKSQSSLIYLKIPEAFNYWMKIREDKLQQILDIISTFGHAYLLLDDTQDNSLYRRNLPAAHRVFGIPLTINASVHGFSLGLEKALQLHPEGAQAYSEQFLCNIRGQGSDVYWSLNNICPDEHKYKEMAEKKCGSVFVLATQLMQLFSTRQFDFENLAKMLGLYLHIRDDFCNLYKPNALEENSRSEEFQDLKCTHIFEDFTEGKFSWPIVHAILHSSEAEKIKSILKQNTRDVKLKLYCLALLEKTGSYDYTRQTLSNLDQDIRKEIVRLGHNPVLEAELDDLLNWKY